MGVVLTIGVYGAVALIVKMDDIGLHLTRRSSAPAQGLGRALVRLMPLLLKALSHIGVAAMVWVGGGILLHGLEGFGLAALPHALHAAAEASAHAVPFAGGVVAWLIGALGSAVVGLAVGGVIVAAMHLLPHRQAASSVAGQNRS